MARKRASKRSQNTGCLNALVRPIGVLIKALIVIVVGLFQLLASIAKWLNQQKINLPIGKGYQTSALVVVVLVCLLLSCSAMIYVWTNSQLQAIGILPTDTPTLTPTSTATSIPTPTQRPTLVPTPTPEPTSVAFDVDIRSEQGFIFVEIQTPYQEIHKAELFDKKIIPTQYDFPINTEKGWPKNNKIAYPYFSFIGGPYPPAEYTIRITAGEQHWTFPFDIGQRVTQEEFGNDWPLIPECKCGIVGCLWDMKRESYRAVVFHPCNTLYNISYVMSGLSREEIDRAPYLEDIADIQRDDPDNPGSKIPLDPLLEIALEACDR